MSTPGYVLITPAKNEQATIGRTIQAVAAQTVKPNKWFIVDDGSTDRTRYIIDEAAEQHRFIWPVYAETKKQRDFSSKVSAFAKGYEALEEEQYEFIGNLDADISFGSDYYEQVIAKLRSDGTLGIVGGRIYELVGKEWRPQTISSNSVAGAIQIFRRECYEAIGGYIPISAGGIDAAAEIMARAHGWGVRTIRELPVYHHRRVATGRSTALSTRFGQGITNYCLGYHPLFQLSSSVYRCINRPVVLGSLATLLGYGWSWIRGQEVALSKNTVRYLRSEQMARLRLCYRDVAKRQKQEQ